MTDSKSNGGFGVRVQKFGTFLSGMVMPNIAAFIAWGLITALFISDGYLPDLGKPVADGGLDLARLVGPMLWYLLPLLIASTGGRMVHGARGSVVATVATMGVIIGATVVDASTGEPKNIPMFMGAMIMGPLAAWIMKKIDSIWDGKIKPGFEMLIDNFSAGIVSAAMAVLGFWGVAPVLKSVSDAFGSGVQALVEANILPAASVIIEPAKVLFLNNALNHGVITPLGTSQALENGKSLLFLMEANPGPGLGILAAFALFGVGLSKASAPGAIIIQFLGGIHEVYFPYILMKPALIIAAIAGGATGIATNLVFQSGLIAPASPGSIFAVLGMTAPGSHLGVILSVLLSATVSFLIAGVIIRATRARDLATDENGVITDSVASR